MNRSSYLVSLIVVALLVLNAQSADAAFGQTQKILNILDAPVVTGTGRRITMDQMEVLLREAAIRKQWQIQEVEDGHLEAWINVRQHMAKIDIVYSTEKYSITYKDSAVLKYNGKKIHRNYNKWIRLLNDQIVLRLNRF